MKTGTRSFQMKLAAVSVFLALSAPPSVQAFQIKNQAGEVIGSFDTTISLGGSWRAQGRDPSLVSISNGGTSRDPNADDGNLIYDKNKLFSNPAKVTHELGLKRDNYGIFARGTYFYDFAYHDQTVSPVTGYGSRGWDRMGTNGELLDFFVHGSFDLGGRRLNARLGQQVVSWGESTFLPNGINVINAVDVTKLRGPGSELREALLPQPMIWASQELSKGVNVEGFYQFKHRKVQLDPRGTFFSATDIVSDDGNRGFIGFGRRKDQHFPLTNPSPNPALVPFLGPFDPAAAIWIPRAPGRDPSDGNQYGVAIRLFLPEWNNTELGFFHMNYHSRTPVVSGTKGTPTTLASISGLGAAGTARYFVEYPENIRLFGLSFNTSGPAGIALQGEYSYRPNQPLQLPTAEILLTGLGAPSQIAPNPATILVGADISGFRRIEMHQVQVTATKAFGPTFGAEQLIVLGEIGYTYLNLPTLKFAAPGVHLPQPGSNTATSFGSTSTDGFVTSDSWGYRLLGRLDFPNAIGPATLSPRIAFSHDVHGVSPTFNQGTKAITFGLGLNYKQNWQADISYTAFWGGRTYAGTDPVTNPAAGFPAGQSASYASSANPLKDRDFISLSLGYSF